MAGVYNLLLLPAALLLSIWSTAPNEFELYLRDFKKNRFKKKKRKRLKRETFKKNRLKKKKKKRKRLKRIGFIQYM